jgi:rod shape-determining protein MreD
MARCIVAGALVTYVVAVLQTTIGGWLTIWGVAPDLLLVWTISIGLLSGQRLGAFVGFASGVTQGALQQGLIAAFAISKTVSGCGAGLLATKMFKENWLVPALCAVALTIANDTTFLLLSRAGDWTDAGRIIGVRAVYHAVLAPPAFALTRSARRALTGRREEVA